MEENPNGEREDVHLLTTQRQFTGRFTGRKWESSVINIMLLAWIQRRGGRRAPSCCVGVDGRDGSGTGGLLSLHTGKTNGIRAEGQTFQTEMQQVCLGDKRMSGQKRYVNCCFLNPRT